MGPRRKEVTLNRKVEDTSGRTGEEDTSGRRGKEVTSMGQRILGMRQEEVARQLLVEMVAKVGGAFFSLFF